MIVLNFFSPCIRFSLPIEELSLLEKRKFNILEPCQNSKYLASSTFFFLDPSRHALRSLRFMERQCASLK